MSAEHASIINRGNCTKEKEHCVDKECRKSSTGTEIALNECKVS